MLQDRVLRITVSQESEPIPVMVAVSVPVEALEAVLTAGHRAPVQPDLREDSEDNI